MMKSPRNHWKYNEITDVETENGGEGGIRTHEGLSPLPVFKTGAFNRSATSPLVMGLAEIRLICQ